MKKTLLSAVLVITTIYSCKELEGPEGLKSLLNISEEAAGSSCLAGGQRIDVGIDKNRNDILDADEVESVRYVCNGTHGSRTLTEMIPESDGPNCVYGGVKLIVGADLNNNNILDDNESTAAQYLCNGQGGVDGHSTVYRITPEDAGANCLTGGHMIQSGLDTNDNQTLDDPEVELTQYVCNGLPTTDKQVRFDFQFGSTVWNTSSISGTILPERFNVLRFNKEYYGAIDSVVFAAKIWTSNASVRCIVELYNITDNTVIDQSSVSTNALNSPGIYVFSEDIKDHLPVKEITLGLKLRAETEGTSVWIDRAHLFIYKK